MKRMHIHVGVENLADSIGFYSALFGAKPVKTKEDYAKWLLEDPRVNFAISTRVSTRGVDHLGIQVENENEMTDMRDRLAKADMSTFDEGDTVCCYARSDKTWVKDPSGLAWETYHTMEDAQVYAAERNTASACCVPSAETVATGEHKVAEADAPKVACCG